MRRTLRPLLAILPLSLLAVPVSASTETTTSPAIGPLGQQFSPMGGLVIDMLGINGKRLTAQISPTKLFSGQASSSNPFFSLWTESGIDGYALQTLLGGGFQQVNIRITLQDGDSGSPNPVYSAVFGTNTMPYSGSGILCPECVGNSSNAKSQPPGWDFDAGTSLYVAIPLQSGGYINCGYMGQTTTYQLDTNFNVVQTYTGFPGVYALTDYTMFPTAQYPRKGYSPFAVTGWFSVPSAQLPP